MWDSFISVCILFFEQTKTWSLAVMKITCHNSFPNSVASFSKIKYKPLLQLNINATASMSDPEWRDLPGVRCWWNDSAGVEMRDAGSPGLMRRRRRSAAEEERRGHSARPLLELVPLMMTVDEARWRWAGTWGPPSRAVTAGWPHGRECLCGDGIAWG